MEGPSAKTLIQHGFICFDLGLGHDLHLTVARRYDATEQELIDMQTCAEHDFTEYAPINIAFGNFCKMGEHGTIPAYRVSFDDPRVQRLAGNIYRRFYKEAPGKVLFPEADFHITVDTPEKRAALETVMRQQKQLRVSRIHFKTRIEGGEPEVTDTTWKCMICHNINPMGQKTCLTPNCDQWKPKESRPGDWMCCGINNFASRTHCMKCGRPNSGSSSAAAAMGPYEIPPAVVAVVPSAPPLEPAPKKPKRADWWCPTCQFKIFGSKDKCGKCGFLNKN